MKSMNYPKHGRMKKQTAVDYMFEMWVQDNTITAHVFKQAKEMEKQQVIKAVYDGMGTNFDPNMGRAEQYYNETYEQ